MDSTRFHLYPLVGPVTFATPVVDDDPFYRYYLLSVLGRLWPRSQQFTHFRVILSIGMPVAISSQFVCVKSASSWCKLIAHFSTIALRMVICIGSSRQWREMAIAKRK